MSVAYQAARDFKFAGHQYHAGDAVPRAAIIAVDPEKEGTLLRTEFIVLPPESRDLNDKKKDELIELARLMGHKANTNWRKAELIDAIEGRL